MCRCMVEGCKNKAEYTIFDSNGKELKLCSKHLMEKLNNGELGSGSCPQVSGGKCEACQL